MKKQLFTKVGFVIAVALFWNLNTLKAQTGAALNFDGTNPGDNVILPSAISTSLSTSNKITVEAWIRPTSLSALHTVVGNFYPANHMQFMVRASSTNYQFWIGNSNTGGYLNVNSTTSPTLNVWQHVAGVWNGTVSSIYINGVLSATLAVTYPSLGLPTNPLIIGGNGGNENFNGDIDEVRIWKRALCQPEIQNNMTGEIATGANGLLANYHFNQGVAASVNSTVTSLADASGNAYTGTLTGIALTGATSNWVSPGGVISGSNVAAFASPTLSIAGTNTICTGSSSTLTASGNVSTFAWLSGPTTASYAVTPSVTTTYSIVGTNSLGCQSNIITNMVTVNSLPTVTAVSNTSILCVGQSATLTANGAAAYVWNTSATTTVIAVSPTVNTTYTVTGTTNGCIGTTTITQAVSPCTGIEKLTAKATLINIYPNPNNGVFTVDIESSTTINIIDVLGKVVYTQKLLDGKYTINLSNLNNGLYILKAESNGQLKTVRLIKE